VRRTTGTQLLEALTNLSETAGVTDRKAIFTNIFKNRLWKQNRVSHSGLDASGPGSTLVYVQELVAILHTLITELKRYLGVTRIRMLDMPCGDMAWMSRFLETRNDINYTGFDIVPEIIQYHQTKYARHPWKFERHDLVKDDIPFDQYDLILSRDTLQHLTHSESLHVLSKVSTAFVNAKRTGLLLTTTYPTMATNADLPNVGGYIPLNLELPPIALQPPLCRHNDGPIRLIKFIGLWSLPLKTVVGCNTSTGVETTAFGKLYSCTDWSLY
jgi:2-polyprenyl-3-methyl-5-hydroxy-6-metoxy-1,4-benzoquinol methylase